jgi:hypothetical protein
MNVEMIPNFSTRKTVRYVLFTEGTDNIPGPHS